MNGFRLSAVVIAVLVVFACRVAAQPSGSMEGTVRDPSQRAVHGALVCVTEIGTGAARNLETDARGEYRAAGLAPGIYQVASSKAGFQTQLRRNLELAAGRTLRLDFTLGLGQMRETVVVIAEPPLVSAAANDWGGSIEKRALDALPLNGRDLFDLATQERGVTLARTANRTQINGLGIRVSVNGARPNQNSFRLDGIYVNDASGTAPASGAGTSPGVEAIQELHLVTSPFSAEYGRATGGVFTAVSKSGTNDVHGSLYEYFRNSALDARNFFDAGAEPIPPRRKNQFGGLLSGPLRRNRRFFLVNYEGIRDRLGRTVRPATPTAEARQGILPTRTVTVAAEVKPYLALYPLPNGREFGDGTGEAIASTLTRTREDYVAGKLDEIFSERWRFSSRYTMDAAQMRFPEQYRIWEFSSNSRHQFVHTETQYVASPTSVHTLRVGFSRVRNFEDHTVDERVPASLSFIQGRPIGSIEVTGLGDFGGTTARARPRRFVTNDYQLNFQTVAVRGKHSFQAGVSYDRVQFNQVSDINPSGFYRFDSLANFLLGKPKTAELMAPGSDSTRGWRQHLLQSFFQQEWRPARGLSLTFGIRYETYTVPTEVHNRVSTLVDVEHDTALQVGGALFENPSHDNFAPRVALAWDPAGDGKTVFRAGAGVFFDTLGSSELITTGARTWPFYKRLLVTSPSFPGLLQAAASAPTDASLDVLQYHAAQPYVMQYQFAIQRQIGADTVAELNYAGSRGVHLVGYLGEVNPTRPERLADGRLYFPAGGPRVNPAFSSIGMRRTAFNSFYQSFHAGVRRRWKSGLRLQARYSLAKSIDETSSVVQADYLSRDRFPTMLNHRQNRGLSEYDVRNMATGNLSWALPAARRGVAGAALGGWELHAMAQVQTGYPFSPVVGFDRARTTGGSNELGQRPNYAGVPGQNLILGDPARYFDPLAFSLPEVGTYGNLGRNRLIGPGLVAVDAAAHKPLWKTDRYQVRIRLEAFNILNRPNFQVPSALSLFTGSLQRVGSAGRITETSTPARQVQLALRWSF
jgi:hypothetical protein